MALFKRGKWWWTDFSVNGVRYRISLDTTDWREALSREKEKIAEAQAGKLSVARQSFARLPFTEAAKRYLDSRKIELSERSLKKERQLLVQPSLFFGATPLTRITGENLLDYRESRAKTGVGPGSLNMEMGVMRRILKRAKRWHLIAEDIRPLKERRQAGRALKHEDKLRLLKLAKSKPEWQVLSLAITLALNTTMRGCELKGLRWRDINLIDRTLTIERVATKTDAGERVIPLNASAMASITELYHRAQTLGGIESHHYLFPACENGNIDPTRPQTSWRTAWRRLTRAIQCPACGELQNPGRTCRNDECKADISKVHTSLAGLRFHDLRHHAITELAESQASDQTIMSIAGHVSPKMLAHYSHIRMDAKRKALEALSARDAGEGYDTNNDTNVPALAGSHSQVIEINGRPGRTRTSDLFRVKEAL